MRRERREQKCGTCHNGSRESGVFSRESDKSCSRLTTPDFRLKNVARATLLKTRDGETPEQAEKAERAEFTEKCADQLVRAAPRFWVEMQGEIRFAPRAASRRERSAGRHRLFRRPLLPLGMLRRDSTLDPTCSEAKRRCSDSDSVEFSGTVQRLSV